MAKIKVGIVNVTGYAGVELARLLLGHPGVELSSVTGRSAAGQKLDAVFPHLPKSGLVIEPELGDINVALVAMPHKEGSAEVTSLLNKGAKVIDLSADFRLKDAAEYAAWYGCTHPAPELLSEAVYGLTELHRADIAAARLIANPGCYPTSAILALAPAVKKGLIEGDVIVDSKSGISGAGRTLSLKSHYPEANDDTAAYALEGHRHLPEIVQELSAMRPEKPLRATFVPHLVPMTRGILSTCYARLSGKLPTGNAGKEELMRIYSDFYKDEPFVRIASEPPHTKCTSGSNLCLVYPTIDNRTGMLIVISCIDNLIKGAAGQAVQNMNVMLGLPETTGLEATAIWP